MLVEIDNGDTAYAAVKMEMILVLKVVMLMAIIKAKKITST